MHLSSDLNVTAGFLFRAALTPSTLKSYCRVWSDFAHFIGCAKIQSVRVPFGHLNILRYVAFLFNSGFSYPSILFHLSALTYWVRYRGWPLVTHSYVVLQALKGVRALSSAVHRNKFPITPDVLRVLCRTLLSMNLESQDVIRLWAIFLLSFYFFL